YSYFNHPPPTAIYTFSLHDALPISSQETFSNLDPRIVNYGVVTADQVGVGRALVKTDRNNLAPRLGLAWRLTEKTVIRGGYGFRSEEHTSELQSPDHLVFRLLLGKK